MSTELIDPMGPVRFGFIILALDAGVDALKIMPITCHTNVDALKEYDRRENDFDTRAGRDFL
jgi:hypothetical protein